MSVSKCVGFDNQSLCFAELGYALVGNDMPEVTILMLTGLFPRFRIPREDKKT
jgi:hypothetical protein